MKSLLLALAFLVAMPASAAVYPTVPSPTAKGFDDVVLFDTVPGDDFFLLYFSGAIEYNTVGGCGTAASPCFGLSNGGELYRFNASSASFDLEASGMYFDNEIPSTTESFQSTAGIRIDNGSTFSFPMTTPFQFTMAENVFDAMIGFVTSSGFVLLGAVIALLAGNYLLRKLRRWFLHDPVLERARSVRGHTDAILAARKRKGLM